MKRSMKRQGFLGIMMLALLLAMAIPETALGQGRGRGHSRANWENNDWGNRGWHNNGWSNNKKCGKFVNCHDARDGRWDGRGPRGDRVSNRAWRNRSRNRTSYNNRFWNVRRNRWQNR